MTAKEIIKAGKAKVRNSPLLYPAYISLFEEAFGRTPECPTCGSAQGHKDWSAFEHFANYNEIQIEKTPTMTKSIFTIRDRNKIYSYDYKHQNGRTLRARTWGHSMTEDFAKAYLTNGTAEQLEARKAEFKVLPENFDAAEEVEMTVPQIKQRLTDMGMKQADLKGLKKDELVALLQTQEAQEGSSEEDTDANDNGTDDLLD